MPILCAILLCLLQLTQSFSLQPCSNKFCEHGRCDPDTKDKCICDPCYRGDECKLPDNVAPVFAQSSYSADVNTQQISDGQVLLKVVATDSDSTKCAECDCSKILYSLDSSADKFTIDKFTGEIRAADKLLEAGEYSVKVTAANIGDFQSAATTAEVKIRVEKLLSRQRRATVAPKTNVTFDYKQTYPVENKTSLKMGEKLAFQVTISFPQGLTNMNMEMFSPDNETVAVIMICDATITHIGSKIQNVNKAAVMSAATYEAKSGQKWPYVRIALPLGDVTVNAVDGTADADYQIVIAYEAVFLYNDIVSNNSVLWVSAGAEYNNESVIWIGQTSFLADMDPTNATVPLESPTMNITGDSSIYPGAVSLYTLDITVPYLYTNFTVDVFGPLNNSELLTVCGIYHKNVGNGFNCAPTAAWPYDFSLVKQRSTYTNFYRSTLSFAATKYRYTNKAWRMPNATTDDHRISLSFALSTNKSAVSGTSSYLGATVDFGSEVLTGYKTISVGSTTLPPGDNTTSTEPNITMTRLGASTLPVGVSTFYELVMDTVPGKTFDFEIQALMPANNSLARMRICSLNITYAGRNLLCLNQHLSEVETSFQILYSNTSVPSNYYDYAVIKLPRLINMGTIDTADDALANRIVVKLVATVNNHTLNVPGESAYVTMGVTYADRQWVSISQVNFSTASNVSSLGNDSLPLVNMNYVVGDENFNIGETAVVEVTTILRRGVTYEPMEFEFIAPYQNNSAVMSVCDFQLLAVGRHIGCSDINILRNQIKMTSKANNTVYDKVVFTLGTTTNVGPTGTNNLTTDDELKLRFSVKMRQHPAHSNGSIYYLSYGFQFSNDQIWIGQVKAVLMDPAVQLPALAASDIYAGFEYTTTAEKQVQASASISRTLLIKLGPQKQTRLQLHISVPSFASLCTVAVGYVGKNISCANNTEIQASTVMSQFNIAGKQFANSNGTFDLGYVHNSGSDFVLSTDNFPDDNTLAIRIIVSIDENATPGAGNIEAKVSPDGSASTAVTETLTVVAGTPTMGSTNNSVSAFNLVLIPLIDGMNDTAVYAPGQAFRAQLNLTIEPSTTAQLSVQFVSPVNTDNQLDIVHVMVTSAGKNLPCLLPCKTNATFTKRNNSLSQDFGTLNLGFVTNHYFTTLPEDNTLQIEAIGRIWTNSTAMSAGHVSVNCLVFVGDQRIYLQTLNLTIDKNASAPQYQRNTTGVSASFLTTAEILGQIGQDIEVGLNVEVPEFISSPFKIDVRNADTNTTAWATVNKVNITQAGVNLVGLHLEPYELQTTSTYGTAQKDVGSLMTFTIQNAGITTRCNDPLPPADRNNFTVVFNVRVADPLPADNGTVFQLSVGLQVLDRIIIGLRDIRIVRTGAELPTTDFLFNVSTVSNTLYMQGNPIVVNVNITNINGSSAEMQNPVLFLHTPYYIEFVSFNNFSYLSGIISYEPMPTAGMKFVFNNSIFLGENVQFSFNIAVKTNITLPGGKATANATSVYELTYRMHDRVGNPNTGKWLRQAGSVHFMVQTHLVQPSSCNEDLGMNDTSKIPDCGIIPFMEPFVGYEGVKVRPTLAGWKPHVRGGDYASLRHISVLFGVLKYVSRIVLYSDPANKPTCINVYKTKDGRAFSLHETLSDVTAYYNGHVANFSLTKNLLGRGIRLGFCGSTNGSDSELTVKFDLIGCNYTGNDFYQFNPCTRRSYQQSQCSRSFLTSINNDTIYYCDHVLTNAQELVGTSKCYKGTAANPRVWQYLGPAVGQVVAYQSNANRLFAYAQGCAGSTESDRSFVMSEDGGATWAVTNPQAYISMISSPLSGDIQYSRQVNWTLGNNFSPAVIGTQCDLYSAGDWKLCYEGIYHTTNLVVSWNSCCLR